MDEGGSCPAQGASWCLRSGPEHHAADERVESQSTERRRRLLLLIVICALVFVADIVVLNVVGEVTSGWWPLAVPVGLLLVPIVGIVCFVLLLQDRRGAKSR